MGALWSSIFVVCAISVASNLDNAGVGIAYGVRGVKISAIANAIIAIISGVATYIAGVAGNLTVHYVSPRVATVIGAVVMLLVGLWVLTEPWREKLRKESRNGTVFSRILDDPMVADFDKSHTISLSEALILGVALALNALAGGFDAGTAHIGVLGTSIGVAVFSYALLGVSAYIGRKYAAEWLGNKATIVAGLLLIAIGIHQLW